jgi:hypothetical protein
MAALRQLASIQEIRTESLILCRAGLSKDKFVKDAMHSTSVLPFTHYMDHFTSDAQHVVLMPIYSTPNLQ